MPETIKYIKKNIFNKRKNLEPINSLRPSLQQYVENDQFWMELTVDGVVVYKQINKSPQKMTNFWMRTLDNPKADVCLRNVYIGSEEINWTIWGQWSDCSHDCGGGTRTRTELCQQQSPHSRLRFIGQYQSKSKTTFN